MVPKVEGGEKFYEAQGQVNLTRLMRFTTPVNGVPYRIRTGAAAVKGRCPNP